MKYINAIDAGVLKYEETYITHACIHGEQNYFDLLLADS